MSRQQVPGWAVQGCAEQQKSRSLTRSLQHPGCGRELSKNNHSWLGNNRVSSFNPSVGLPRTRTIAMSFSSRLWGSERAGILPVTAACITVMPQHGQSQPGMQRQAGVPAWRGWASAPQWAKPPLALQPPRAQCKLQLSLQAQPGQGSSGHAQAQGAIAQPGELKEVLGLQNKGQLEPKLKARTLKTPLQLLPYLQVQFKDWRLNSFLTQVSKSRAWLPLHTLAIFFTRGVH